MNAQDRDLLQSFLRQVSQSRPAQKDPIAESMIHSALAANPDALYLLAQRALAAETALKSQMNNALPAGANTPISTGIGGFVGTAASVATGVVAGGFLLEGIQSVLGDTGLD